jgi:Rrf2 family protein
MKLSTQADYAVRAVYELARRGPGCVVHTCDIAAAQNIPGARLTKVIQELARADLVRTQRGQQGGVTLARPADAITVRDVYEAVEGPILLCRCRRRAEPCDDGACVVHDLWDHVETLLAEELQATTFAALAAPHSGVSRPDLFEEVNSSDRAQGTS